MDRKKVLELDKICRVCISERKDMRPLFSEKIADMLMDVASVHIEETEGWPDKICVQCVHSVSRCHAFKTLVERSDRELRGYIKSLTVRMVIDDSTSDFGYETASINNLQLPLQPQQQQTQQQPKKAKKQKILLPQQLLKDERQKQQCVLLQTQQLQLQQQQQQQQQEQQQQQQQQQLQQQQQHQQQQQQQQHQLLSKKKITPRRAVVPQTSKKIKQKSITTEQTMLPNNAIISQIVNSNNNTLLRQQQQTQQQQQQLQQQQQQQQQQQLQTQQLLPATAAMPQQIMLPNGQILTTAQIITGPNGAPQIAQIINTGNSANVVPANPSANNLPQTQFAQLLQTSNGQTLQLISPANGNSTLQFLQLVPQRSMANAIDTAQDELVDHAHMLEDDATLIEQTETHLIDDDDEEEDEDDEQTQICETIEVEDDIIEQHQQSQQLSSQLQFTTHNNSHEVHLLDEENLTQSETQELEYLEDVTVTTTGNNSHHQHMQLHNDQDSQHHLLHEDDDIIEEIHTEEEMMDDDSNVMTMKIMHDDAEFLTDESLSHTHLVEDADEHIYTVMDADDEEQALMDADVTEVLNAACGTDFDTSGHSSLGYNQLDSENLLQPVATAATTTTTTTTIGNSATTIRKNPTRKPANKTLANSRQLTATANSIAAAVGGEDELKIDSKFLADFISQQTTSLGSGRYVCNLCRQEFKQFRGLHNHMYSHSNWIRANCKKQPQCEICFKSFKGPGMLKMHMKTHQSSSKTPTCNICGKSYKSRAILYRHRQTHQQRSYACALENCRKTFSTHVTLRAHSERKHLNVLGHPKYKCGECGTLYEDVTELQTHVEITGHGSNIEASSSSNNSLSPNAIMARIKNNPEDVIIVTQT